MHRLRGALQQGTAARTACQCLTRSVPLAFAADKQRRQKHATCAVQVDQISPDDYFRLNAEFTAWLREARGLTFGDLTAEAARSKFSDFVDLWNARKLGGKFYRGMEAPTMRRSNHQWGIRAPSVRRL